MPGTRAGGLKAEDALLKRLGSEEAVHRFRVEIGGMGGRKSRGGGFAKNRELASTAGAKGGRASRRGPAK